MKFLPLIVANLGRHKRRTVLTIASVALALFLFASLRTVVTSISAGAEVASARRMVVMNANAIVFPLPTSYRARLGQLPGVERVSWANWFGGQYGDGKVFFATFAVDPESYFAMYPEISVPEDQKQAFFHERSAACVGRGLMEKFGWHVGQDITIRGTIFPGDWTFTIRAVYTPLVKAYDDRSVIFHWDYLDERTSHAAQTGWYILELKDPSYAGAIVKTVDDGYRNSSSPTKTGDEKSFAAQFITMWGNIQFLMNAIGTAVVFAILMVTANAMMMSARERTGEYAVLKTIGFTDRALFAMVMLEAVLVAGLGALIGLGGAKLLYHVGGFSFGGFLPGFDPTDGTLAIGAGLAGLLALASGVVPAVRAARLPIVQALRHVE
ncbi:MAG: ABC transporter permease [Gemmatimonadales bacterium]